MTDLKLTRVPVSKLVPDPANVRTHDSKNLEAIKHSLATFGQRKPIVVARGNAGELVVIAGNGTLEAAKALGWKELQVAEVPEDWDADKARAFAIADNRTAELADWNDVALAEALVDLDASGWDIGVLGFEPLQPPTEGDLADAFGSLNKEESDLEQITFTLHRDQAATVREAMQVAKDMGEFIDTGNPNSNGNAIARVCEMFLGSQV